MIDRDAVELHDMTMAVASGQINKQAVAKVLEEAWLAETHGEAAQEATSADEGPGGEEPQPM